MSTRICQGRDLTSDVPRAWKLCDVCASINLFLDGERWAFHHNTIEDIAKAAENGCDMCRAISEVKELPVRHGYRNSRISYEIGVGRGSQPEGSGPLSTISFTRAVQFSEMHVDFYVEFGLYVQEGLSLNNL